LIARLEHLPADERKKSERSLWSKTKAGAMTVLRIGLRMKAEAADFAELSNVEYQKILEQITALISKNP